MNRHFSFLFLALPLGLLVACGGGGGDGESAPAVADKYVGTWTGCNLSGGGSQRDALAFTKTGDASVKVNSVSELFDSTDCSGVRSVIYGNDYSIAFSGTKTINTLLVDKAIVTSPGLSPSKQVSTVQGTSPATLFIGDTSSLDAEGYPSAVRPAYTKQ